jgi:hypothetical protein
MYFWYLQWDYEFNSLHLCGIELIYNKWQNYRYLVRRINLLRKKIIEGIEVFLFEIYEKNKKI